QVRPKVQPCVKHGVSAAKAGNQEAAWGSRLVRRERPKQQLSGRIALDWHPDGLRHVLAADGATRPRRPEALPCGAVLDVPQRSAANDDEDHYRAIVAKNVATV